MSDITWDEYWMHFAEQAAKRSKCLSRQIGCVIVRDNIILSTGYNGPPKGYTHCGAETGGLCPRKVKGYKSGEHLDECPATHAEANAIAQAASIGLRVNGGILYINTVTPCKSCMGILINAGISEIVFKVNDSYDTLGLHIAKVCGIKLRYINQDIIERDKLTFIWDSVRD